MRKKTIAIACNGSLTIGMGHITRTLVLAEKLKNELNIYYIRKNGNEYDYGAKEIKKWGYPVYFENDKTSADIMLLDSYDVNEKKLSQLRKKYNKLIYIDDLTNLSYYDCDIIINKSLGGEKLENKYNTSPGCKLLLGAKYALLREEFEKSEPIEIKKEVKNVLITMGGTDPKNTSVKILNILKDTSYTFNVVVSNFFSEKTKSELKKLSATAKNIILHQNPQMAKLMSQNDLAITANGGTAQEIASMGLPQITITVAENQESPLSFGETGEISTHGGRESELNKKDFLELFTSLSANYSKRLSLSESQKRHINKSGASLAASEILKII